MFRDDWELFIITSDLAGQPLKGDPWASRGPAELPGQSTSGLRQKTASLWNAVHIMCVVLCIVLWQPPHGACSARITVHRLGAHKHLAPGCCHAATRRMRLLTCHIASCMCCGTVSTSHRGPFSVQGFASGTHAARCQHIRSFTHNNGGTRSF